MIDLVAGGVLTAAVVEPRLTRRIAGRWADRREPASVVVDAA